MKQSALVAHELDVPLTVVIDLLFWVLIAINVHWRHLRLQLLDIVEILVRDVMHDPIEGTLQLAIHWLQ
jgi:hypothetical protein